jgi:hypothetical protein
MADKMSAGSAFARGVCTHCRATMLIHDGSTGEITCQMCARSWECDQKMPGHEMCGGRIERSMLPAVVAPRS